jgi:ABC-type Fe3+-hydroxamate transport system substrate-binding protein
MPHFTDQAGRIVFVPTPPKRIISLVPSQTELLYDLGLDQSIIGITKFCIHPDPWFRSKQRIGGTKNPNIKLIRELKPDLIIGNKEENRKEDIEVLDNIAPTWLSDVNTLEDALEMISQLGYITERHDEATSITTNISKAFNLLKPFNRKATVAYLIWKDPYMVVASNTFIHDMLLQCGFQNVFADRSRYPAVTIDELIETRCEYILLSTEPYPFTLAHSTAINALIPSSKIILADGEYFSWYGTRLLRSPNYFQTLIDNLQHGTGTN